MSKRYNPATQFEEWVDHWVKRITYQFQNEYVLDTTRRTYVEMLASALNERAAAPEFPTINGFIFEGIPGHIGEFPVLKVEVF